jgi:chitin disaccharide deacetylase
MAPYFFNKSIKRNTMKSLVLICFSTMLFMLACAQPSPTRLIVRADDIGSSQAANEAIILTCTKGIATSAEVMVPCAWFPEAVKLLNQHPAIDVGVHITITSEWDNIKWRPLTHCPSLVDEDGYFYPMMWPNPNYPGRSVMEVKPKLEEIEREFRAQIEMAMKYIPAVSHISGHMGSTGISDEVRELTARLAKEYYIGHDLPGISGMRFDGPKETSEEKINSFIKALDKLEPGKTYLFVEHPSFDTPEMRSVSHIGYENVSIDRQGVTDLFMSEEVKAKIRERGIELISYADFYKLKK